MVCHDRILAADIGMGGIQMEQNVNLQEIVTKILEQEMSDEMYKIRQLVMLRTALEGDVKASRIPAPKNITEVGGYYNLLAKQNDKAAQKQLVASALGLPTNFSQEMIEEAVKKLFE